MFGRQQPNRPRKAILIVFLKVSFCQLKNSDTIYCHLFVRPSVFVLCPFLFENQRWLKLFFYQSGARVVDPSYIQMVSSLKLISVKLCNVVNNPFNIFKFVCRVKGGRYGTDWKSQRLLDFCRFVKSNCGLQYSFQFCWTHSNPFL